jgi:hypothetical protein
MSPVKCISRKELACSVGMLTTRCEGLGLSAILGQCFIYHGSAIYGVTADTLDARNTISKVPHVGKRKRMTVRKRDLSVRWPRKLTDRPFLVARVEASGATRPTRTAFEGVVHAALSLQYVLSQRSYPIPLDRIRKTYNRCKVSRTAVIASSLNRKTQLLN